MTLVQCQNSVIDLQYSIQEEQDPGVTLANLRSDTGLDSIQGLAFSYLTPRHESLRDYFRLDSRTGIMRTSNRILDRDDSEICQGEELCVKTLDIAARTQSGSAFHQIKVEITVLDINDNAPEFRDRRISKSISERSNPGLLFPIVPAIDEDSPEYGVAEYHLNGPSEFRLGQTQNSDGSMDLNLHLTSQLDRERQDFYQVSVVAFDGGTPPKSGTLVIDIFVIDENDNHPQFDHETYMKEIREDLPVNSTVVVVHAVDPDAGPNGDVEYFFTRKTLSQYGALFKLDRDTGRISLRREIDRENYDSMSLGVIAQDKGSGSMSSQAVVLVTVLDVNDHTPRISLEADTTSKNTVAIDEHCDMETFVAHISVSDPDSGPAGQVNCSMKHDTFRLKKVYDKEYSIVTDGELDRERVDRYDLLIICRDGGDPQQTTSLEMTVQVADINDHAPVFPKEFYNVTIPENNAHHAAILQVTATDEDAGLNGEVVYYLQDDAATRFHVDPKTGLITALLSFDREVIEQVDFYVTAMDRGAGDSALYSMVLVSVTITDLDDEAPTFQQNKYIFSVPENLAEMTEVGKVTAVDEDLEPFRSFTYHLDGKNSDIDKFMIDPDTGYIFTKASLDRETKKEYHLSVVAQSESIPKQGDTAHVDIVVEDRNDNDPVIGFPSKENETVHVPRNAPIGHTVMKVNASDADADENARLRYSLIKGEKEFLIGPRTGQITVNSPLMQEVGYEYELLIMVQDGGKRYTHAKLKIHVDEAAAWISVPSEPSEPQKSSGLQLSTAHVTIIIGVTLGALLIAVILAIIAVVIRRRRVHKKPPPAEKTYWPKSEVMSTTTYDEVPSNTDKLSSNKVMQGNGHIIKPDPLKQVSVKMFSNCVI